MHNRRSLTFWKVNGLIAQLVEHQIEDLGVGGSSPPQPTTYSCGGMVDTPDLGSGAERREGSSPFWSTISICGGNGRHTRLRFLFTVCECWIKSKQ